MPGLITQEQADKIKSIIDNDANLAAKYFEVKDLPDWWAFFLTKGNGPESSAEYHVWLAKVKNEYAELVNKKLLEDDTVTGACVMGGLAIAMAKANQDINLFNLWSENEQGLDSIEDETVEALEAYFGLPFDALEALQKINDHHESESSFIGVSPEELTALRREALKEQVDKFVTGESSNWYFFG